MNKQAGFGRSLPRTPVADPVNAARENPTPLFGVAVARMGQQPDSRAGSVTWLHVMKR